MDSGKLLRAHRMAQQSTRKKKHSQSEREDVETLWGSLVHVFAVQAIFRQEQLFRYEQD
jgi:hypothetical protein